LVLFWDSVPLGQISLGAELEDVGAGLAGAGQPPSIPAAAAIEAVQMKSVYVSSPPAANTHSLRIFWVGCSTSMMISAATILLRSTGEFIV
jgi:hypothetical protein